MPSVIKYEILLTQLNLILGCYNSTDLQRPKTFHLHIPSAGLCQKFCTEDKTSNTVLFFGVQVYKLFSNVL